MIDGWRTVHDGGDDVMDPRRKNLRSLERPARVSQWMLSASSHVIAVSFLFLSLLLSL
jgi:hypothetical protein